MGVFDLEATLTLNSNDYKEELKNAAHMTGEAAKNLDARAVAIGNVMAELAKKGGEFFVGLAKTGIEYNAQIETYTTALTTALGSEAKAAATIEKIKQDAARTPYSVDGLVSANSYLIQAGESAESARATIMALGDAVAATGGGNAELQRMAQNLQQVKNVGKATSMDIRQFAMAGIDIYGILADYTGKTKAEVQGLTITYEMLSGALQHAAQEGGKYFDAMGRQSQTLNGQVSTLKDNIQQKLGDAFSGIANTISTKILPAANKFVSSLDVSKIASSLGDVTRGVAAVGAAIAAVSFVDWVTGIGNVSKALAKMTPVIKDAAAGMSLLIEGAGGLGALAGVGAILGVATYAAIDYNRSQQAVIEQNANMYTTSGEVMTRMIELRNEYAQLKEAADAGATDAMLYDRMTWIDTELGVLRDRAYELSEAEDNAADGLNHVAETADTAGEGLEAYSETSQETINNIAALIDAHNKLHENITKKVKGWFGLFDEAKTNVKANVKDMMANMQSQIDFNTKYSANLDFLAQNGMANLGTAFQNMGAEGAAYADALVQAINDAGGATSEGGQKIINDFNALAEGVGNSQTELSASLTEITGTLESQLAEWGVTAEQAAEALNVSGTASASGSASVAAYIAAIAAGSGPAYAAGAKVARAASAGFGSSSGGGRGGIGPARMAVGCDYIPYDDFPALLHKGEMVIPAKISEDLRDFVGAAGKSSKAETVKIGGAGNGEIVNLLRELISATQRPIVLDSGELVGGIRSKMDNQLGELDGYGRRGLCMA